MSYLRPTGQLLVKRLWTNSVSKPAFGTRPLMHMPKPIYFTPQKIRAISQIRCISDGQPQKSEESKSAIDPTKATANVPAKADSEAKKAVEQKKKKSLGERIKHELNHYWDGTKLFAMESKISMRLVWKMVKGGELSRREVRQLRRTVADMIRLVPFVVLLIIPFAELLLPVLLKVFPNMLPSTYEDPKLREKKQQKIQQVRVEMSRYLKETIAETVKQRKAFQSSTNEEKLNAITEYVETQKFINKIRSSSDPVSNDDLLRISHIFEDDLTLDNLTRPQLVSICRYMGINSFGTDNYLKYQIRNRVRYITADDKMIKSEGVDSLTIPELQAACQSRGVRFTGVSPARMRWDLQQWLDLHLDEEVPAVLLILSRIMTAGEPVTTLTPEVLQATLSSLPDNLVNEATLRLAELGGAATNKQKLDVLEEQEDLIEDEAEQEEKVRETNEELSSSKSEESADNDSKEKSTSSTNTKEKAREDKDPKA
ncbi:LETM1 domain-containing protein ylh47 [Mycoemilia scoparia]|uniref:LETM1 domain-containing protein ylh47 n=1 Tax=Mycoemilia scoparia TaxID=417184 RepID=A0A9W7ZYA0_9FUNG|nr:LETM1 domain-containing protein ylh47 [Mycoemilia scoparia]